MYFATLPNALANASSVVDVDNFIPQLTTLSNVSCYMFDFSGWHLKAVAGVSLVFVFELTCLLTIF